jgi:outer membrane biosynthesis protein TonB
MQRAAPAPQPTPKPAPEPEPMDIPEIATEQIMAAKPEREAEQEEEPEEKECITLRRSDFLHFQDTLVDIRSQIRDVRFQFADLQRDARQDRLEV